MPLQGANLCFISLFYFQGHQSHPDNQDDNEFCLELLAGVALFSTLITQKLVFAIWGLCWYGLFPWILEDLGNFDLGQKTIVLYSFGLDHFFCLLTGRFQ